VGPYREWPGHLATSENLHPIFSSLDTAFRDPDLHVDLGLLLRHSVQVVEVQRGNLLLEGVGEPSFRQAPVQGHLAALEAGSDLRAATGFLPLVSLAGSLPVAWARAPSDPLPGFSGSLCRFQLFEFSHFFFCIYKLLNRFFKKEIVINYFTIVFKWLFV